MDPEVQFNGKDNLDPINLEYSVSKKGYVKEGGPNFKTTMTIDEVTKVSKMMQAIQAKEYTYKFIFKGYQPGNPVDSTGTRHMGTTPFASVAFTANRVTPGFLEQDGTPKKSTSRQDAKTPLNFFVKGFTAEGVGGSALP